MKPRGKGVQCYLKSPLDKCTNYIIRITLKSLLNVLEQPKFSIGLLPKEYVDHEYVSALHIAWEENNKSEINNYWGIIRGK